MFQLKHLLMIIALGVSGFTYAQSWTLVWSDEFNGVAGMPSTTDWGFDACPCYNGEKQNYTVNSTNNVRVDGAGNLVIEVKKESSGGKQFSSARLISKKAWTYGRMEVRAKLPDGQFLWPAIWMLPQTEKYGTWPNSGEIDIMENWNRGWDQNAIFGTLHTQPFNGAGGKQGRTEINNPLPSASFHVYAAEWYTDQIKFFVDDKLYYTYYNQQLDYNVAFPFIDNPFHFILNIAVEQDATGNETWAKRTMEVDYVRVYQGPTQGPAVTYNNLPGTVEAENFYDQYMVLNQNNSFDSGTHVAYIDPNDWMDYKVNVNQSGTFKSSYRVASPAGGQLQLISGTTVLETVNVPATGSFDSWVDLQSGVLLNLNSGQQILRIKVVSGSFNFDKYTLNAQGIQIQAENYSLQSGTQNETCSDVGGGLDVGWVDGGDWLLFDNVNITTPGTYQISFRVASAIGGGLLQFEKGGGTQIYGSVSVPNTGGWQNWQTITTNVTLSAGMQGFGIKALIGGWNINWVKITKQ
jgi:beta-glucanase (GH16 family)